MKYVVLLISLLVFACKPVIKDFDKYQKASLQRSSFAPSDADMKKTVPTVVVLDIENTTTNETNKAIAKYLTSKIEQELVSNKLASLVSRDKAGKLSDEIKLAETKSSKGNFPAVADYVVSGDLTVASFSSEMVKDCDTGGKAMMYASLLTSSSTQACEKKTFYDYKSATSSTVKVYSLPALELKSSISFDGNATDRQEAKVAKASEGIFKSSIEFAPANTYDEGLVKKSVDKAIKSKINSFKEIFAKKGYISEKRTLEDKVIFKITLGSNDGIFHGTNVIISQKFNMKDDLSGKTTVETNKVGQATVANVITENASWIVLKDQSIASKIKLGDEVKVTYVK